MDFVWSKNVMIDKQKENLQSKDPIFSIDGTFSKSTNKKWEVLEFVVLPTDALIFEILSRTVLSPN